MLVVSVKKLDPFSRVMELLVLVVLAGVELATTVEFMVVVIELLDKWNIDP